GGGGGGGGGEGPGRGGRGGEGPGSPRREPRLQMEARYLVLVLVRHELVEVSDDRVRHLDAPRRDRRLGGRDVEHEAHVRRSVARVLVIDQLAHAEGEQPARLRIEGPAALEAR